MKKFAQLSLVSILSMAFALPVAAKTAPKVAPVVAKAKPAPAKATTKAPAPKASASGKAKAEPKAAKKVTEPAKSVKNAKDSKVVSKVATKNDKAGSNTKVTVTSLKSSKTVKVVKPVATVSENKVAPAKTSRQIIKTSYKPVTKVIAEVEEPKPVVKVAPPAPRIYKPSGSVAHQYGLNQTFDPVGLRSSVALVVDQNSWTTLYEKNVSTPLPIASITKLMTAMVVLDARLDMDEYITISDEDAAHYRTSRLSVGTSLPRRDVMMLALMSSENRAAYALGRTYPGGISAFVDAMNAKAMMLGMNSARFVDPSGLSPSNQASAMDLAKMVNAATQYKTIRELSTNDSAYVYTANGRYNKYVNSNRLISRNMGWDIGLQKTGTLSAAGKCLVLQTRINGTPKIMVFLDSRSADSRVSDAVKLKDWVEGGSYSNTASSAPFGSGSY